jgi:hypothetical protein
MKRAAIFSIIWIFVAMVLGIAGLWVLDHFQIGGRMTPERAGKLGQGFGVLLVIGLFPLWWKPVTEWMRLVKAKQEKKNKRTNRSTRRGPDGRKCWIHSTRPAP